MLEVSVPLVDLSFIFFEKNMVGGVHFEETNRLTETSGSNPHY